VVLTHDLDFGAILAATQGDKPSVVQIRADDVSPNAIGELVINALRQMATDLDDGALLTIEPNRTRLRILPLHTGRS
jgi:predicted nuclease of predicted toxin-antitoxin system